MPTGLMHFKVKSTQHHYSWNKPHTVIHNLIFGSLWADHVSVTKYSVMLLNICRIIGIEIVFNWPHNKLLLQFKLPCVFINIVV